MGRKRINNDDDETVSITVRQVKKEELEALDNVIGSGNRSEFIRECIRNKINQIDTVTELKQEIRELEYQICIMQENLASKKQELGEILQRQTENADNELMIDTILKSIKTFNAKYGGITEAKIRGIVREDYADAIPIQKILNRVKNDKEINIIDSMELLHASKAYNPVEQEQEKTQEEIKQDKISKLKDNIKRWFGNANNNKLNSKKTVRQAIDENKGNFTKRCENIGLSDKEIEDIIREMEQILEKSK